MSEDYCVSNPRLVWFAKVVGVEPDENGKFDDLDVAYAASSLLSKPGYKILPIHQKVRAWLYAELIYGRVGFSF